MIVISGRLIGEIYMKKTIKIKLIILLGCIIVVLLIISYSVYCHIGCNEVNRFKDELQKKYHTEFIYDGKEKTDLDSFYVKPETLGHKILIDGDNITVYKFHPIDNPKYSFNVFYKEYYTYEVFPTKNEWYQDDFEEVIKNYIITNSDVSTIDLTKQSIEDCTEKIYNLQEQIITEYLNYHVTTIDINIEINILYENRCYRITFDTHDKSIIEMMIKNPEKYGTKTD